MGDSTSTCLPLTHAATLSLAVMKSVAALGFPEIETEAEIMLPRRRIGQSVIVGYPYPLGADS